jgi:hypothetical protein
MVASIVGKKQEGAAAIWFVNIGFVREQKTMVEIEADHAHWKGNRMNQRKLGTQGLTVAAICLGYMGMTNMTQGYYRVPF